MKIRHCFTCLFFLILYSSYAASSVQAASDVVAGAAISGPVLPMLHTHGTDMVDPSGKVVVLTGINLGGWLVEEPWMQPFVTDRPTGTSFPQIKDHVSLWGVAKKRFGDAGMVKIRNAFRSSWIEESDFTRIHSYGLNCVRLPFIANIVDEPGGFSWLDRAIEWGARNHVYVILDMHGCPGSQSDQDWTGQADLNNFFKDPKYVEQAKSIWREIAQRYRDNPTVAGYDLINEPMGTPGSDTLYVVEDHLYQAVRSVDPNHIIFIEDGYTGVQWMPFPGPCEWSNVAYSTHCYNMTASSAADQANTLTSYTASVDLERNRRSVPFYIGEYCIEPKGTPEQLTSFIQTLQAKHISSTIWTYKVSMSGGSESFWGLYSNAKPIVPLNFFTDSEAELIGKCAEVKTENMDLHTPEAQAFLNVGSGTHQ